MKISRKLWCEDVSIIYRLTSAHHPAVLGLAISGMFCGYWELEAVIEFFGINQLFIPSAAWHTKNSKRYNKLIK